jgi:hypothetical protein
MPTRLAGTVETTDVAVGFSPFSKLTQAVNRFSTFTDPSPVARSYPVPVVNAGTFFESTSTPFVFAVVLLQLGDPPAQGTESLPLVMSLKTQAVGGATFGFVWLLELQMAGLVNAFCI